MTIRRTLLVCLLTLLATGVAAADYAGQVAGYIAQGRESNLALNAAGADVRRAQA